MTKREIALLLIKEDLKYHKLVKHLAEVEVHLEFYPDIATAVQELIARAFRKKSKRNGQTGMWKCSEMMEDTMWKKAGLNYLKKHNHNQVLFNYFTSDQSTIH